MNIDRKRPPQGCDLDLWLSETINDAIRDCREQGMEERSIAFLLVNYAHYAANIGMIDRATWERWTSRDKRKAPR